MRAIPGSDVDEGWAWLVLLASYFNLLICSGLSYVAGMFQLVFLEQFEGSVAFTSWITALFSSFMQLGGPLSSVVSNIFNCRTSVMTGGVLMSVGMFISSMANSLELLFVTFGLIAGAGIGLTYTASIIVLNYFFEERRTLITGVALSASGLGILASPQISRFLFDNFSWRETLVIMGGAAAQVCVAGAIMLSKHEAQRHHGTITRSRSSSSRFVSFCVTCCGNGGENTQVYRCAEDTEEEENAMLQMNSSESYNDISRPLPKEELEGFSPESETSSPKFNIRKEDSACPHCKYDEKGCYRKNREAKDATVFSSTSVRCPPAGASSNDAELISSSSQTIIRTQDNKTSTSSRDIDNINVEKASYLPFPAGAFVYGSHGNGIDTSTKTDNFTGSHQELTAARSLLRIKALSNAANSRSHQELSAKPKAFFDPSKTSSNPNLIRHRLGGSNSSKTFLGQEHPSGHVVVISRNASLLGLVPSTSPLDVIITSAEELRTNPSLHSKNSILESKLVLTEGSSSPKTEKVKAVSKNIHSDVDLDAGEIESVAEDPEPRHFPPLYRNKYFWLLCISLFVENAGCGIFNIHFPSFVKTYGLPDQQVTNILSVNGFAILFGRCLCGALANAERENDLLLWWALHVLGGLCVCLMPAVGYSYVGLIILVYGMGNYYGTVYAVLSSMTIEMVGLTSLATAFGVEMICAGLGYFVSPPLAGLVVDLTGNYDHSMYSAGMFYITGGLVIFVIPLLWPSFHRSTATSSDTKLTPDRDPGKQDGDGDS